MLPQEREKQLTEYQFTRPVSEYQRTKERTTLAQLGREHLEPLLDPEESIGFGSTIRSFVEAVVKANLLGLEKLELTPEVCQGLVNEPLLERLTSYRFGILTPQGLWPPPGLEEEEITGALKIALPSSLPGIYGRDKDGRLVLTPIGEVIRRVARPEAFFPRQRFNWDLFAVDGVAQEAAGIKPPLKSRPIPETELFDPLTLVRQQLLGETGGPPLPPWDIDLELITSSPYFTAGPGGEFYRLARVVRKACFGVSANLLERKVKTSRRRLFRRVCIGTSEPFRIGENSNREVEWWAKKLGITPEELTRAIAQTRRWLRVPKASYADISYPEGPLGFNNTGSILSFALTRESTRPPVLLVPVDITSGDFRLPQLAGVVIDFFGLWKNCRGLEIGRERRRHIQKNGQVKIYDFPGTIPPRRMSVATIPLSLLEGDFFHFFPRVCHLTRSLPWTEAIGVIITEPTDLKTIEQVIGNPRECLSSLRALLKKTGQIIGGKMETAIPPLRRGPQTISFGYELLSCFKQAINGDPLMTIALHWEAGQIIPRLWEKENFPVAGWGFWPTFFPELYQFLRSEVSLRTVTTRLSVPGKLHRLEATQVVKEPRINTLIRKAAYWPPATEEPWQEFITFLLETIEGRTPEEKAFRIAQLLTPSFIPDEFQLKFQSRLRSLDTRLTLRESSRLTLKREAQQIFDLVEQMVVTTDKPISGWEIRTQLKRTYPETSGKAVLQTLRVLQSIGIITVVGPVPAGVAKSTPSAQTTSLRKAYWYSTEKYKNLTADEKLKLEEDYGSLPARIIAHLKIVRQPKNVTQLAEELGTPGYERLG